MAVPGHDAARDNAFLLPAGEHEIFVAIGHQSLGQPRQQAVDAARRAAEIGVCEPASGARALVAGVLEPLVRFPAGQATRSRCGIAASTTWPAVFPGACGRSRRKAPTGSFPANAGCHPQDSVYQLFAALSSNHPELCKAQMEYLLETLPMAQAVARNVYYLEGARYPWHATPGLLPYLPGHSNEGYYLHEHHVNGWLAEFVRRYLQANGWERSQVVRYYPVLREIARFFSSMLTARGNELEIAYVPSCGQEESDWDQNRKNIFDLLVSAKWSLQRSRPRRPAGSTRTRPRPPAGKTKPTGSTSTSACARTGPTAPTSRTTGTPRRCPAS